MARRPTTVTEFRKIPLKRLFFVMKHVAEENRWAEYTKALAAAGHTHFIMDLETVEAVKHVIKKRAAIGGAKSKRRPNRIDDSASCGSGWGGHPAPPPKPPRPDPPPDGGGGGGGSPPRPDPPDGGGNPPPPDPPGGGGRGRARKKDPKARPKTNPPRDKKATGARRGRIR